MGDVRDALVVDDDPVLDALHVVHVALLAPLIFLIAIVFFSHSGGDDGQGLVEIVHDGVVDIVLLLGNILGCVVVLKTNK